MKELLCNNPLKPWSFMEKTFKSCDRKQMLLLPSSLLDWLPKGHIVYYMLDMVEQLDLSKIYTSYKGDGREPKTYYHVRKNPYSAM